MMSDREFINGIYKKAEFQKEQECNKSAAIKWTEKVKEYLYVKRHHIAHYGVVAGLVVMISLLTFEVYVHREMENKENPIALASNDDSANPLARGRMRKVSRVIRGTLSDQFEENGNRYLLLACKTADNKLEKVLLIDNSKEEVASDLNKKDALVVTCQEAEYRLTNKEKESIVKAFCMKQSELDMLSVYGVEQINLEE